MKTKTITTFVLTLIFCVFLANCAQDTFETPLTLDEIDSLDPAINISAEPSTADPDTSLEENTTENTETTTAEIVITPISTTPSTTNEVNLPVEETDPVFDTPISNIGLISKAKPEKTPKDTETPGIEMPDTSAGVIVNPDLLDRITHVGVLVPQDTEDDLVAIDPSDWINRFDGLVAKENDNTVIFPGNGSILDRIGVVVQDNDDNTFVVGDNTLKAEIFDRFRDSLTVNQDDNKIVAVAPNTLGTLLGSKKAYDLETKVVVAPIDIGQFNQDDTTAVAVAVNYHDTATYTTEPAYEAIPIHVDNQTSDTTSPADETEIHKTPKAVSVRVIGFKVGSSDNDES